MPIAEHDGHIRVTEAERAVLRLVADGFTDEEIAARLGRKVRAVRATLHRFHDRTDLGGRRTVAWTVTHRDVAWAKGPRRRDNIVLFLVTGGG